MASTWPVGKGPLGGTCPECNGQVMLHWRDKVQAEYICLECGLVLRHAGYRRDGDRTEMRQIIADVFDELERNGIKTVRLHPFICACNSLSRLLYNRPINTLSLKDLDAMGLETYCGIVTRKKR